MPTPDRNTKSKANTSHDKPGSALPTELIQTFLNNQSTELSNQTQEIDLRKQSDKHAYDYACKALEAQKEDRSQARNQKTTFMKYGFWLSIVLLFLAAGFIVVCIQTGNVQLVYSSLKALAYIVPSMLGGYFFGFNRGKNSRQKPVESGYAEIVDED